MKKYFSLIYWLAVVLLMSLVFASVVDGYSQAFLLAIMFLPGALFVKFFIKDLSFENRLKGILYGGCLAVATLLIEYLCIVLTSWYLFKLTPGSLPDLIFNPVFIWLLLAAFIALERIISYYIIKAVPPDEFITFTSERKKISVRVDSILLVESRDSEVMIRMTDQTAYRTKMKISQWESVLDNRFLRVHRSYIINKNHISHQTLNEVTLKDLTIEVSRKYRDAFRQSVQGRS
ncbi:MAG: LytTr DNA-binding domain protein [Bacteroidetes bacterium ADurb.Bin037]|nr:MAG: LytTr DNA-binding domain protein [Bacteroidetes bacterium ADurb.Bin037]HPW78461.1 LytTR family DNA-binding domain-containing protein [Bacteroidales bacterium]HQB55911.1 LytTR family DNA-binding domain-containing protein [Bacteroidales bacterium]